MTSETGERRAAGKVTSTAAGTRPPEPENLPCPRCDSTNTKFCYYNNYNLSQPRHFCKSCRRYWTRGGTLRNVPVGGGSRKSSSNKRHRIIPTTSTVNTSTTTTTPTSSSSSLLSLTHTNPITAVPEMGSGSSHVSGCLMNLNEAALPESLPGSFSSLMHAHMGGCPTPGGFMPLSGGFELGLGPGMGYGFGILDWPMDQVSQDNGSGGGVSSTVSVGDASGCNTWPQMGGVDGGGGSGSSGTGISIAEVDCFVWPELAISTPGNLLK